MTTQRKAIIAAVAGIVYLSLWFLPVNGPDYPGWKAFRVAFAPIWPYAGFSVEGFLGGLVSVASALTNAWFLVSMVVLAVRRDAHNQILFWILLAATIVNASWLLGTGTAWGIGYFAWLSSFVLLTIAVRGSANATLDAVPSAAA